jgi:hypothetical protein
MSAAAPATAGRNRYMPIIAGASTHCGTAPMALGSAWESRPALSAEQLHARVPTSSLRKDEGKTRARVRLVTPIEGVPASSFKAVRAAGRPPKSAFEIGAGPSPLATSENSRFHFPQSKPSQPRPGIFFPKSSAGFCHAF